MKCKCTNSGGLSSNYPIWLLIQESPPATEALIWLRFLTVNIPFRWAPLLYYKRLFSSLRRNSYFARRMAHLMNGIGYIYVSQIPQQTTVCEIRKQKRGNIRRPLPLSSPLLSYSKRSSLSFLRERDFEIELSVDGDGDRQMLLRLHNLRIPSISRSFSSSLSLSLNRLLRFFRFKSR